VAKPVEFSFSVLSIRVDKTPPYTQYTRLYGWRFSLVVTR